MLAIHAASVMRRNTFRIVNLIDHGEQRKARQIQNGVYGFLKSCDLEAELLFWASALLHEFDCVPDRSHSSGIPFVLQSSLVPELTSQSSAVPFPLQSGSHSSGIPLALQS